MNGKFLAGMFALAPVSHPFLHSVTGLGHQCFEATCARGTDKESRLMIIGIGGFLGVEDDVERCRVRIQIVVSNIVRTRGLAACPLGQSEHDSALVVQGPIDDLGAHLLGGIGEVEAKVIAVTQIRKHAHCEAGSLELAQTRAKHEHAVDGYGHLSLGQARHAASFPRLGDVSTRMLIFLSLLCGLAILVAFTLQILLA